MVERCHLFRLDWAGLGGEDKLKSDGIINLHVQHWGETKTLRRHEQETSPGRGKPLPPTKKFCCFEQEWGAVSIEQKHFNGHLKERKKNGTPNRRLKSKHGGGTGEEQNANKRKKM